VKNLLGLLNVVNTEVRYITIPSMQHAFTFRNTENKIFLVVLTRLNRGGNDTESVLHEGWA
jgi:hypothetical protein